jgi:pimeloyl-ACP methyl ester carboxylesterase
VPEQTVTESVTAVDGTEIVVDAVGLGSDRLTGIDVPVLALYGARTTPGLVGGTKAVAALVPSAVLEVVPGEDHSILQRPAVLAPVLATFFG